MKTEGPARIPIPWKQRWRSIRLRGIPIVVFSVALLSVGFLWKDYVAAPTMVGQAEPVVSNVSCYKAGVLAELTVGRFQQVKAGDPIGQVLVTDPRILTSTLAVIHSEIEALRSGMKPVLTHQRAAVDYDQLRLDCMKRRAEVATAKVNLQLAESELSRMEELFKDKIVAPRLYEQTKATRDRLQNEVDELNKLVEEGERSMANLQLANGSENTKVSMDPLRAAIAVEESKLRLTEAELSPIVLKAPIDGIVSSVFRRAGEAVTPGQPIVAISTHNAVRIVGYLRPPIMEEPKKGMKVQVRARNIRRDTAMAEVVEVGTQLEALPASLASPVKVASSELGLPVDISLPPGINIRPGELVDLTLVKETD